MTISDVSDRKRARRAHLLGLAVAGLAAAALCIAIKTRPSGGFLDLRGLFINLIAIWFGVHALISTAGVWLRARSIGVVILVHVLTAPVPVAIGWLLFQWDATRESRPKERDPDDLAALGRISRWRVVTRDEVRTLDGDFESGCTRSRGVPNLVA